jgi:hypothetical protein
VGKFSNPTIASFRTALVLARKKKAISIGQINTKALISGTESLIDD